ncbi:hypothetical protein EC973_006545 [Apophysomyces ossiformis]|uniref:Uncharacterized protein n=1 Tax=Apophysomyces ossiformis TaxID=679940 RepID=A0A8H7ERJ8_9FUNG|nr:hypothetical protein EC973_006545 [Apophysomyces ossiformis]
MRRQRAEQEQQQQAQPETAVPTETTDNNTAETIEEEGQQTATTSVMYVPRTRPRTRSAAATAVIEKANKRKKKKDSDEDMSDSDQEGVAGPSAPRKTTPGRTRIAFCKSCNKRFSQMSNQTQALCTTCIDNKEDKPRKKEPKRRRIARKQGTPLNGAISKFPTLQDLCIDIVARHILDVEALGDISFINMDKIAKIICRNRQLTSQTARLFMGPKALLDMDEVGLLNIAHFCVNVQLLQLSYCGRMTDNVLLTYGKRLHQLRSIELSGPFLVTKAAWQQFFDIAGAQLESFGLRHTLRFTTQCVDSLVNNCPNLKHLRLSRLGKMHEDWLKKFSGMKYLETLELGWPPHSHQLSSEELIELLSHVGNNLTELSLPGCSNIDDDLLIDGILKYCPKLQNLDLSEATSITSHGIQRLFNEWKTVRPGHGLKRLLLDGCRELDDEALKAVLRHSGKSLTHLNIHSLDKLTATGLEALTEQGSGSVHCAELEYLDCGFVRAMDDFVLQKLVKTCSALKQIKVWGCHQLTDSVQMRQGLRIEGREQEYL